MYVRLFLGNKEPETFIVILIWAAIAWRITIPTPQANAFYIFTSISKNNDSRRIKIGTLIDKIIQKYMKKIPKFEEK